MVEHWDPFKKVGQFDDDYNLPALKTYLTGLKDLVSSNREHDIRNVTTRFSLKNIADRLAVPTRLV